MKRTEMEKFLSQQGSGPETTQRILGKIEDGGILWEPEEGRSDPIEDDSIPVLWEGRYGMQRVQYRRDGRWRIERVGGGWSGLNAFHDAASIFDELGRRILDEVEPTVLWEASSRKDDDGIVEHHRIIADGSYWVKSGNRSWESWPLEGENPAVAELAHRLIAEQAAASASAPVSDQSQSAGERNYEYRLSCAEFKIARLERLLESRGLA